MSDKVLVAYGSKHGMTAEIAERIGKVIRERGFDVDVASADKAKDPAGYRAVILGSGVYAGMWRRPAARFLRANAAELARRCQRHPAKTFAHHPALRAEFGDVYRLTVE